jgi:ERF superfamily
VQPVETTDGDVSVSTVLVHVSGERFASPALAMRQPDNAQALGSLLTYLRRYSLLAALGLATEDDDDGKAATTAASMNRPAAPWPARTIKGGMVTEIAQRVTQGDMQRATELAAEAWELFALEQWPELPAAEAVEKIEAAVEFARQETAADPELELRSAPPPPAQAGPAAPMGGAGGPASPDAAPVPDGGAVAHEGQAPALSSSSARAPWTNDANMRADLRRFGVGERQAREKLHALARELGLDLPAEWGLTTIRRDGDRRVVRAFADWVRSQPKVSE